MTNEKVIIHSDLNNFYASVECLFHPELKDKPVAVGGDTSKRHGIILAKNALAKAAGVKTAEALWVAREKCPELIIVPPHHDVYGEFSRRAFEVYQKYSDFVEPFGPDECWLDCSIMARSYDEGEDIAHMIRQDILHTLGITVSVGVAFTKPFAKLCSDLAQPNDCFTVSPSDYQRKLWTLPCSNLLGVGRATGETLSKLGIKTIGQLAHADEELLSRVLGANGRRIRLYALGQDGEKVHRADEPHVNESVGHGITTPEDMTDYQQLNHTLYFLAEKVNTRLIRYNQRGYGVSVSLRRSDLTHVSKQRKYTAAIFSTQDIVSAAMQLCCELLGDIPFCLRAVSVSVFELVDIKTGKQMSMFDDPSEKHEKMALAIDKIRKKHGSDAIVRAGTIGDELDGDSDPSEENLPFRRK